MVETPKWANDRRGQIRYTYKPECYPILECQTGKYKVLNIAEEGMKLEICRDSDQPIRTQSVIQGHLQFSNGKRVSVSGELIWIIGNEMGIKPKKPIKTNMIMAEIEKLLPDF